MADNYLEKKFEDLYNSKRGKYKIKSRMKPTKFDINSLFRKTRSHRGYDKNFIVTQEILKDIIEVNKLLPSAKNQQVLRFKPLTGDDATKIASTIKLGALLPELKLPQPDQAPNGFIIICAKEEGNRWIDIDMGMSLMAMLLKATSIGLNGICIGAFNKEVAQSFLPKEFKPLMLLAIGKGIEHIELVPIKENESHNYYRNNGIHYVPKVDEIII